MHVKRRRYQYEITPPEHAFNTHLEHRLVVPLGDEQTKFWSMLELFNFRKYVTGSSGVVEDDIENK